MGLKHISTSMLLGAAVVLGLGCGGSQPGDEMSTGAPAESGVTTTLLSPSDEPSATAQPGPTVAENPVENGWGPPSPAIQQAFTALPEQVEPLVVLSPAELPAGTTLAKSWHSLAEPDSVSPVENNPKVLGAPGRREVRVLLQAGGGWLEIIEGLRGDLGDLPYTSVSLGDGKSAGLYSVMGGHLAQWSLDGVWYAVLGVDVSAETVTRVARGMRPQV